MLHVFDTANVHANVHKYSRIADQLCKNVLPAGRYRERKRELSIPPFRPPEAVIDTEQKRMHRQKEQDMSLFCRHRTVFAD